MSLIVTALLSHSKIIVRELSAAAGRSALEALSVVVPADVSTNISRHPSFQRLAFPTRHCHSHLPRVAKAWA